MSYIYFIKNETDGYIKIGYTKRTPEICLRELQQKIPNKLKLIGKFLSTKSVENYLIRYLFSPYMVVTEDVFKSKWFYSNKKIINYINKQCNSRIKFTAVTA